MTIVPACVSAAPIEAEIADALRKDHATAIDTIRLIGKPTKYPLAKLYCGRYLTPAGEVAKYAYDVSGVSNGKLGGLLSNWTVVCERLR